MFLVFISMHDCKFYSLEAGQEAVTCALNRNHGRCFCAIRAGDMACKMALQKL